MGNCFSQRIPQDAYNVDAKQEESNLNKPEPSSEDPANQRVAAKKRPYRVDLDAGKTYYYCDCGRSANQPFCDGSHNGTPFQPIAFTPEESKQYYICGCKQTNNAPYCDGTHKTIEW